MAPQQILPEWRSACRRCVVAATLLLAGAAGVWAAGFAVAAEPGGCFQQPTPQARPLACGTASGLMGATGVALAPAGASVFVAAPRSSGVSAFARGADGSLRFLGCVSDNGGDGNDGTGGRCTDGHALKGAKALAVSADGRDLYVAATRSGAIDTFSLTGEAPVQVACMKESANDSLCEEGRGLAGARSIALSPDGRNVYVAAAAADAVTTLARDPATGRLSAVGCVSADGSDGACADGRGLLRPTAVTVSPDGRWVHVAAYRSAAVTTFARDPGDGHLTQTGCLMAFAPRGGSCGRIDPLAGAYGLAVSADGGRVYVAGRRAGAVTVLRLNPALGALTFAGCAAAPARPRRDCTLAEGVGAPEAIAVAPSSRAIFVTSAGGTLAILRDEPGEGRLVSVGCLAAVPGRRSGCVRAPALAGAAGVAVAPDGRQAYVAATGRDALQVVILGAGE